MLLDRFKSIIEEQLPGMVGTELKSVLQDYEKTKKELAEMTEKAERLSAENRRLFNNIEEQKTEIRNYQDEIAGFKSLRDDVAKRDSELKEQILQIKLEAKETSLNELYRLNEIVFKNPRIVTTESINKQIPYQDQYGSRSHDYVSEDKTTTQETD